MASLLAADTAALARIEALAAREAERLLGSKPKSLETEVKLRARGAVVFVDVDLEALL